MLGSKTGLGPEAGWVESKKSVVPQNPAYGAKRRRASHVVREMCFTSIFSRLDRGHALRSEPSGAHKAHRIANKQASQPCEHTALPACLPACVASTRRDSTRRVVVVARHEAYNVYRERERETETESW